MNKEDIVKQILNDTANRNASRSAKDIERGAFNATPTGKRLHAELVTAIADVIAEWVATTAKKRAGNQAGAYALLKGVPSKQLASITIASSLNGVMSPRRTHTTIQSIYISIGDAVLSEITNEEYKTQCPEDYKQAMKFSRLNGQSHKAYITRLFARRNLDNITAWGKDQKALVGMTLFTLLHKSAPDLFNVMNSRKATSVVLPTPALESFVAQMNENYSVIKPLYRPFLEKPTAWTEAMHHVSAEELPAYDLINSRDPEYRNEILPKAEMPEVLEAANIIQDVAFKVNTQVLDYLTVMKRQKAFTKELVQGYATELPPKLDDDATDEAKSANRKDRFDVYQENTQMASSRLRVHEILSQANKYKGKKSFYFPVFLDFRTRVYPQGTYFTPQGSDMVKALLLFSSPEVIKTKEDSDQLAIHGANLMGFDKASFEDRVAHVYENEKLIRNIVRGASELLHDIDKPFQFLAFCFEWVTFLDNGFGTVTCLPCAIDGSNNGSQILGLMGRDKDILESTNVLPTGEVQDVYMEVISELEELLLKHEDCQTLRHIKFLQKNTSIINRKLAKKPVMTKAYGCTVSSVRDIVGKAVREAITESGLNLCSIEAKEVTNLLTALLWEAINNRMQGPVKVMEWFHASAKKILKVSKTIDWTTPTGAPVRQRYMRQDTHRVTTSVYGVQSVTIAEEAEKANGYKHSGGIAPNVVHSYDAAALQRATVTAKKLGIISLVCIHDSFAAHCTKITELHAAVRYSYHSIFSEDQLTTLKNQWENQYNVLLSDVPVIGDIDIDALLESDYFFA